MLNLKEHPHRRYNPLTREWLLVSPHRTQRPWQGQVEKVAAEEIPRYDPACYMCPGNARVGGERNPEYAQTFVFTNDFSALKEDVPAGAWDEGGLLVAASERGICRVLCFSPRHDLTLARMETPDIRAVVDLWADEYVELGARDFINHVQIFENRGAMMGASNPHPHGQIWASESLPNEAVKEHAAQAEYFESRQTCLLCDYLELETERGERVVCANEHFTALVPFWAVWPFETMLVSRRHAASLDELNDDERDALADILKRLTTRYDNLFEVSFPYSMGFHQRPTDGAAHPEWHLHAHFYPPLLRSATVRKFMVGFELLGGPQRDITAESAAERLRGLSEVHYREQPA
jgi:UDPglucose--hexose-1-phosphate uridylyltransferase